VSQLSALVSLCLNRPITGHYAADGMAPLTALPALRQLRLPGVKGLPACLSALTRLEQLQLPTLHGSIHLNNALARLQNHTSLSLACPDYQHIPLALAELPLLQRLCFTGYPAANADITLPQGPWLASIRWLGLPLEVLETALGFLNSAACLEYLCVMVPYSANYAIPEAHPLWTFAAAHPPLRWLSFSTWSEFPNNTCHILRCFFRQPTTVSATAALRLRHPGLRVRGPSPSVFVNEMLDAHTIPPSPERHSCQFSQRAPRVHL